MTFELQSAPKYHTFGRAETKNQPVTVKSKFQNPEVMQFSIQQEMLHYSKNYSIRHINVHTWALKLFCPIK